MKYELINNYKETPKLPRDMGTAVNTPIFSFVNGPKVEVLGQVDESYEINFIDQDKGANIYSTTIKNNMWCSATPKYYVNWKLEVKRGGIVIAEERLSLKGKKVKIVLDTNSLGDILAYIGAVDEFQRKHGCNVECVVFPKEARAIVEPNYSNIKFLSINLDDNGYYANYVVGWFSDWPTRMQQNPRQMSLADVAALTLGLGEREIKPKLKVTPKKHSKKYVCIAVQSTAQFKYWNNPSGWNDVVEYLNKQGYEVWCIDRYSSFGIKDHMNLIPKGVIDKTGDFSLQERMEQIAGAEFFIGLTSGLAWLAWAVGKPVVLISGIGKPWTEFFTPYRIINDKVCHGCTNEDSFVFTKDDWLICPHKKDFECTRQISSQTVITEIERLRTNFYGGVESFDWGWYASTKQRWPIFQELFRERIYERFFKVEEGDVVMDLGAHLGAFSYSIRNSKPKSIIAIEPSAVRSPSMEKNLSGMPVTFVKKGVGETNTRIRDGLNFDGVLEDLEITTFEDIIKENKLTGIDFLKIDCEGGEYSVFSEKNLPWILKNVRKIAGEWHLETPETKEKFRKFRDSYLTKFKNYKVLSLDGVDIKWSLFDDSKFLNYYNEVMIYIDNRDGVVDTTPTVQHSDSRFRVLVTGASGGLGSALEAECLARGFNYIGHGFRGAKPNHISCDFSTLEEVKKMEKVIVENNINCLINNAGIYTNENFPNLTDEKIIEVLNINLVAPALLAKYLYKHLTSTNQAGYIINIISLAGKYPNYNETVYCASKYGLTGLGASLSINQKTSKIKVIDVHLGAIKTRLTKHRPNYNDLIEPSEVSKLILDTMQNNGQYIASSMEIRNTK